MTASLCPSTGPGYAAGARQRRSAQQGFGSTLSGENPVPDETAAAVISHYRSALLPTREQVLDAEQAVARAVHRDALEIVYVVADYYVPYPKPCMHGWGRRHMVPLDGGHCPARRSPRSPG